MHSSTIAGQIKEAKEKHCSTSVTITINDVWTLVVGYDPLTGVEYKAKYEYKDKKGFGKIDIKMRGTEVYSVFPSKATPKLPKAVVDRVLGIHREVLGVSKPSTNKKQYIHRDRI